MDLNCLAFIWWDFRCKFERIIWLWGPIFKTFKDNFRTKNVKSSVGARKWNWLEHRLRSDDTALQ